MQVAPPPASRPVEKAKSSSARAQAGADSDLEAFLRRLSEVNADQAPARQPEPTVPNHLWSPATSTQPTAPARKEAAARASQASAPVAAKPVPVERESAPMFRTGYDLEEESEDGSKKGPRWGLIGAVAAGVVAVALAITIPMVMRGRSANLPRPTTTQIQVPQTEEGSGVLKPSPAGTTTPAGVTAAGQQPKPATQQALTTPSAPTQAPVSSDSMNQQLTAASQLPRGARKPASEDAPPPSGFASAGMDGMSDASAVGSAFKSETRLKLTPVNVSAGVAGGLLIRRVAPQYPSIAKTARVSGTVVLAATISKSGFVSNLQVVSGPPMLRQAAMDAVKGWVYKPYLLNNQPTEVQTTIQVDFNL